MCVCVCVCTCKYIHLYTHVHVIVLYVCGKIDTLLLLLTVTYCNYSLSSSTLVSLTSSPLNLLLPPNTIIQLVVGVTLHTERECQYLLVTVSGILNYYKNNN